MIWERSTEGGRPKIGRGDAGTLRRSISRRLLENPRHPDRAGADGTFVFQFVSHVNPYCEKAKYDLDIASSSLVKSYPGGGAHGTTYPGMAWEPKAAFKAVAEYYSNH
jgi:hypothetical protein